MLEARIKPTLPKVEDFKNPASFESKDVKLEDIKNIKYEDSKDFKHEDMKDLKPSNILKKDENEDEGVVPESPVRVAFGMYKAEPRDPKALLEPQEDISERSPDDMLTQPTTLEPFDGSVRDYEQPLQTSPSPFETTHHDEENTNVPDENSLEDTEIPRKRRRVVLDAVILPTLASILGQSVCEQARKQEIEEKIKMLANPIVKKKANMELSIDTVRERMKSVGYDPYPIALDKATQDVTVTRQFMSDQYGGSPMETFPKISKKNLALHGLNDFMYLNLDLNPQAPQLPGAPGLLFDVEPTPGSPPEDDYENTIHRLFSRLQSAIWLYCGQYEIRQVMSLTKEEWAAQLSKVRNAWATQLCVKGWGRASRARIHLRQRLKREPTPAELAKALDSKEDYKHITPDQVGEAFIRGKETMAVYTLKCVGYDSPFQCNLAEKFPTWVPPKPKPKPKAEKNKRTTKNVKASKAPARASKKSSEKRKRGDLESSDSENSDEDPESYSEDEEQGLEPVYIPHGTRSRPILL